MFARICLYLILILFDNAKPAYQSADMDYRMKVEHFFPQNRTANCSNQPLPVAIINTGHIDCLLMDQNQVFSIGFLIHIWTGSLLIKGLASLLLIILAITLYRLRIRRLERRLELENLVNKRTSELEEKNAILLQNSEDLNEINALLEERQQHIEEQTEEIRINNEWLLMVNEKMHEQANLLEETNKELVLSNATKDKLFSIIAHDLKNPFNSIMSFSEILYKKSDQLNKEKQQKFIYAIYESSHRVYELLENLLQWSRMQTHSMGYHPEAFGIKEQIESIFLLQKNHLEEKEIEFFNHIEEDQMVYADRNMLNTILRNIIGNAIKYTEHGSIHVAATQLGKYITIRIEDTGIGIPDHKLQGIFDIDSKKSSPGTKGESGTGLGLILCRDFIQANGGTISIKSEQGRGTVVTFTLPCKPNDA